MNGRLQLFATNGASVDHNFFNQHRWRQFIDHDGVRIHDGHALCRWKPEFSITRLDPGGLATTVALDVEETILLAIGDGDQRRGLTVGEVIQLLSSHAEYTLV